MERGLQIGLKTGVLLALTLLSSVLQAEEATQTQTKPADDIIGDKGHVEGYFSLPLAESQVDATFIADERGLARGKVLILHDSDGGIDSYGLVHTLRTALPESGWSTMTVALRYPDTPNIYLSPAAASTAEPTMAASTAAPTTPAGDETAKQGDSEKTADNNAARLSAALSYLNAQQPGPIVIVALGEAAPLVSSLDQQLDKERGLVWIAPKMNITQAPEILPILDIAATSPSAKNKRAQARLVWMRQNQIKGYSQRLINGAAYGFLGFEQTVLGYVHGWMLKHFVDEDAS